MQDKTTPCSMSAVVSTVLVKAALLLFASVVFILSDYSHAQILPANEPVLSYGPTGLPIQQHLIGSRQQQTQSPSTTTAHGVVWEPTPSLHKQTLAGRGILGAPTVSEDQRAAHSAVDNWLARYFSASQSKLGPQHTQRAEHASGAHSPNLPPPPEKGQFISAPQMRLHTGMRSRFTRKNQVGAGLAAIQAPPQVSAKLAAATGKVAVQVMQGEGGNGECKPTGSLPAQRNNLIIAAVGDTFDAHVWMSHPDYASYDIVVIHYGQDATFSCPLCKKVFRSSGPKWRLVYEVFAAGEWGEVAGGYGAVMVADDDLEMDTCTVNSAFQVFRDYSLLLAQPSLCNSQKVHSAYKVVFQKPEFRLRYTTFVEIMAPIFDMGMFNAFIGPSLYNAHTGWGLDFVWPFLLKYPRDRIGVIDEVCINHPHGSMKAGPGLYAAQAPYSQKEEMRRQQAEWGYFESAVNKLGYPWQPVLELGGYLKPPPPPPSPPSTLDRLSFWLASLLGPIYPVALLLQSLVIVGVLGMLCWGWVVRSRGRGGHPLHRRARSCPQVLRSWGGREHSGMQVAEYPAPPFSGMAGRRIAGH